MSTKRLALIGWVWVVSCLPSGHAQFTNRSSVLDGSGAVSAAGLFTNLSAAGQPGGIALSTGGGYVNQAGFLNAFLLKPALDSDHDGLADELDQDNDNDGLADAVEIAGSGFAPATPTAVNLSDTDGDGQPDGWEAAAGTDPTDPHALLKLVAIRSTAGGRDVSWLARGNNQKTYVVHATADARQPYATVLFSNTVAGGSGPWYAVTTTVTHASATNAHFYAVEVLP
jgi:hypothetical protein